MYKMRTNLLRKQGSLNLAFHFVCILQDWITSCCQFRKFNVRILIQDSFLLSHINESSPGLIQKLHIIIRCPFHQPQDVASISKTNVQNGCPSSRITSTFQTEGEFTKRISICFLTLVTFIVHTPFSFRITLAKTFQLGHTKENWIIYLYSEQQYTQLKVRVFINHRRSRESTLGTPSHLYHIDSTSGFSWKNINNKRWTKSC